MREIGRSDVARQHPKNVYLTIPACLEVGHNCILLYDYPSVNDYICHAKCNSMRGWAASTRLCVLDMEYLRGTEVPQER